MADVAITTAHPAPTAVAMREAFAWVERLDPAEIDRVVRHLQRALSRLSAAPVKVRLPAGVVVATALDLPTR